MKYVDMHCDTADLLFEKKSDLYQNDLHIDITKMKKGECLLQNFAVFTNMAKQDSSFTKACIDYYYSQLDKNKDYIRPVLNYEDISANEKNGYINAMLTLEDGFVIDNDLNNLDWYYDKGVRMIALTWNYANGIGYPNFTYGNNDEHILYNINTKDGLTDFGIEFVKKCEKLGIIVDVSHLSDKGFYDVLDNTTKPFVASHSSARSICGVARNLSNEMIVALADRGGVMGLNYCSAFIEDHNETYTSIEKMVEHINHIIKVGGIGVIGLGSDFDGIDNQLEIVDCGGMQLLYDALKKYYSDDDIEKIFYKNVLRVYKDCLK